MNIAILNDNSGHFEMFGYLMYLFNKKNTITVFYNNDCYNYINFFETQFGKVKKEKLESFNNCFNKFNKVFVITMNNYSMQSFNEIKDITYGIIHAYHRKSSFINNYITLYPKQMKEFKKIINNPRKKFYCTLPFYNISTNNIPLKEKKYILYIGHLWDNDDDLKKFEKSIKYEIIYFSRRKNKDISKYMFTLNKYLQNSIFILQKKTWHYPYAYTGSLGLAFSFNIPIILPEFKQKEY